MSNEELRDCLYILRFNYVLYEEKDSDIADSIKSVFGKYKQMLELDDVPRKYITRLSKFIKTINTAEKQDILKQSARIIG